MEYLHSYHLLVRFHLHTTMGRKNKSKKGTPVRSPTPPAIANDDNDDLMNQLFSQLSDSEDGVVQAESAAMLVEMDLNTQAEQLEAQPKVSAKDRYKARQASFRASSTSPRKSNLLTGTESCCSR